MKNYNFLSTTLLFILLFLTLIINGCEKDYCEKDEQQCSNEKFFAYRGEKKLTATIINYLRIRNDSVKFTDKFVELYGYPVWEKAVDIYKEDANLLFVPIYHKKKEEIETIWSFRISENILHYTPLCRDKVPDEQTWAFDYLTQIVLNRRPQSGIIFRIDSGVTTRQGWFWRRKCVQYWAGGDVEPKPYEWKQHCWWLFDGGHGGYPDPDDDVMVGHGNIPIPPGDFDPSLDTEIQKLFKGKCNLNHEDIKKLNKAYEEMRQECFYEYIDNYLKKNNVRLGNISKGNTFGQASIDEKGNLRFYDSGEIIAENLKHEWIHLFQRQYHHMTSFGNKAGMMEFELALAQDILFFVEIQGNWLEHAHSWAAWSMEYEKYQKEYMNWLKEMTADGRHYPTAIDNIRFNFFSSVFGEVSISYNRSRGYVYGNNAYTSSAIQTLFKQAKKHCNK